MGSCSPRRALRLAPPARLSWLLLASLLLLGGCATRPINPPIDRIQQSGYEFITHDSALRDHDNLLILAFSGGGTRAAAFSYGVLEALRQVEIRSSSGATTRAIDEIGLITGVSGGSFTALAYGLYGEKLFGQYERDFLYRNVEGELLDRLLSPIYWGSLWSAEWGRSELAADYYDEILFRGATFADLQQAKGPLISASATDLSSGSRFYFAQSMFNILCSDLSKVRLSRAAAASSAVPVVLSPVTFNNYGGRCGFHEPPWVSIVSKEQTPPGQRVMREVSDLRLYENSAERPYIHLVDGGVADNIAMRGVLDVMDQTEALRFAGAPTMLDRVKRIAVIIVNARAQPKNDWDKSPEAPGMLMQLLQATGVPIDHYSYDAIERMRDTAARWAQMRAIRESGVIKADTSNPALIEVLRTPNAQIYVIDVSFEAARDAAERAYLNDLPTSFALSNEAVDRLRSTAGSILHQSAEFQRFLKDAGFTVVRD